MTQTVNNPRAFGRVAVLSGGWVSRKQACVRWTHAPANARPWMAGPEGGAMDGSEAQA
jgi:hypothetical protein